MKTIEASKNWTTEQILKRVEAQASDNGNAYETDWWGIGSYEYFGRRGYDAPRRFLIPRWDDVVVVGLTEEQVSSMEDTMTFTMHVDDMDAEVQCEVVWDEESDLTLFKFFLD